MAGAIFRSGFAAVCARAVWRQVGKGLKMITRALVSDRWLLSFD